MEQTRKQKKNKKHLPLSSLSSSHYALIMSNTCNCFYCHFYFVFFYRWSPSFFFFFGFCCRESLNFITEFVPSCGVLVFFWQVLAFVVDSILRLNLGAVLLFSFSSSSVLWPFACV